MNRLAKAGRLPKDHSVSCAAMAGDANAVEISLAENTSNLLRVESVPYQPYPGALGRKRARET